MFTDKKILFVDSLIYISTYDYILQQFQARGPIRQLINIWPQLRKIVDHAVTVGEYAQAPLDMTCLVPSLVTTVIVYAVPGPNS